MTRRFSLFAMFLQARLHFADHECDYQTPQRRDETFMAAVLDKGIQGKHHQEELEELEGPLFQLELPC
jgi:hypothetical protein